MEREEAKLIVVVELNNGEYHKMECSTVDFDKYGIELYGTSGTNVTIKYGDIGSLQIGIEHNHTLTNLSATFVDLPIGEEK